MAPPPGPHLQANYDELEALLQAGAWRHPQVGTDVAQEEVDYLWSRWCHGARTELEALVGSDFAAVGKEYVLDEFCPAERAKLKAEAQRWSFGSTALHE